MDNVRFLKDTGCGSVFKGLHGFYKKRYDWFFKVWMQGFGLRDTGLKGYWIWTKGIGFGLRVRCFSGYWILLPAVFSKNLFCLFFFRCCYCSDDNTKMALFGPVKNRRRCYVYIEQRL